MCIAFIHNNPVKHGFCTFPDNWKFSSYNAIIYNKPTKIKREEVISWFENINNFVDYHQSQADEIFREKFKLEKKSLKELRNPVGLKAITFLQACVWQ